MTDTPSIRDVLDFWFLPLNDPEHGTLRPIWWEPQAAFDAEIRERFADAFERALAGSLDHWQKSPDGSLALILLCDQLSRNMYRRSAHAFAGDPKALATAKLALGRNYPAAYTRTMRAFFYMPFQHSEELADQELCCALFAAFDDAEMMKYATDHRDIVARFGRFPHRNDALGRVCTEAELEYLKTAERFGQ